VNADIPYLPCLTGYLAMGIGAVMTILVQSSSVFTSAMTPLIAMGMISLERAYPLTLGSNLGTTTTAMLAALATTGPNLKPTIQLALAHFLFNLTGILLFYPLPFTRFPIRMAACLGRVTAKYRWFAVFYLLFSFIFLPLIVFSLTLLGPIAFYIVATPILLGIVVALGINAAQRWIPMFLPESCRTWDKAPLWMHSLEPYDRIIQRLSESCCWRIKGEGYSGGGQGLPPNSSQARLHDPRGGSPLGIENANYLRSAEQSWIDFTVVRQTRL
jgi:sodium-dependent phosphate cotransporter